MGELRKARLTGIRVTVPLEALEAKPGEPARGRVGRTRDRIEVRFSGAQDAVGRLFALAQALTQRLRAVRGARRRRTPGAAGER